MKELHMTISATPNSNIAGLMANESPLLKVGLLYADKVMLSSFSSALMIDFARMYSFTTLEKLQFMKENLAILEKDEEELYVKQVRLEYLIQLMTKRKLKPIEKQEKLQLQKGLNQQWLPFREVIENLVVRTGMEDLIRFVEDDILELQNLTPKDNSMDSLMEDWFEKIDRTLLNPNTYPLFDKTISSLVGQAQKVVQSLGLQNVTKKHISERASHAGFVSDVYQRLPSFEKASFDEIMDIRKELKKPLDNFRSVMLEYSQEINSVPWEEEFDYEAQKLYLMKVVPAVNKVDEACKENKMLMKVINRVVRDNAVRWSGLGLGVVSLTELTNLLYLNAIPVGLATIDGINEWKEQEKSNRNMKLYYYNAVSKKFN
ncbi:hypothetical protein J2S74_004966 [Evansella vedderi]|uniref:Uncharacterized protein n=1 Tax=Evansella vedderi TaxID=38282 RepID=A0ABU0A1Y8_9BACI|nr:hypothetical protein [Evansella vedderi]MDQ0257508.1 hypothetical protein [Evansella vedderi]